jgi:hypothetical protein
MPDRYRSTAIIALLAEFLDEPMHVNPAAAPTYMQRAIIRKGAKVERVPGIEPGYSAWKAAALPLSYTRIDDRTPWSSK